jgi:hypothetical protein
MAQAKTKVVAARAGCGGELSGFEPLTPCMPLMCEWFTSHRTTSPTHTTAQVRGAAEGWVVGRGEATRSAVSGKSLARTLHGVCATDVERLRPGLGALLESFVGRLAVQAAVGSMVVVEVLPLSELVVEHLGVVDHDPLEEPVELLGVDAMGALDFAVEPRRAGLDVDVAGAFVQHMPVEAGAELDTVEFLTGVKPGWMS